MLNSRTRLRCVEELVTSSFEGTINVGDVGEIVASLLLMFAFDSAHSKQCGAKLPQKVRLGDFISSFMGTSSELKATVKTRKEMQGLFANGVVFFSDVIGLARLWIGFGWTGFGWSGSSSSLDWIRLFWSSWRASGYTKSGKVRD
jgi:hypothetical protein